VQVKLKHIFSTKPFTFANLLLLLNFYQLFILIFIEGRDGENAFNENLGLFTFTTLKKTLNNQIQFNKKPWFGSPFHL
jgi:hypothetical protein